jgi:hypothetical protein
MVQINKTNIALKEKIRKQIDGKFNNIGSTDKNKYHCTDFI